MNPGNTNRASVWFGVVGAACLTGALPLLGCGTGPTRAVASGASLAGAGPSGSGGAGAVVSSTLIGDQPFSGVTTVALVGNATANIDGALPSANAVDTYDIGPLAAGDRLVITTRVADSLDPVVAVFDSDGNALIVNDDRNYYGGDFNAAIDMVNRRETDHCLVSVAVSAGSGTRGDYTLSIRRSTGGPMPDTNPQQIYLNFDGADRVVIGRRDPVFVPAFEGSLIGVEFADHTDDLIDLIVTQIRRDYIGLSVSFVSSRETPEPVGPHTTIHFGAYDPGLLGIADYVDEFNLAETQQAIIFVDTFKAFLPLGPSEEEMAAALANVASHEAGHLLGLNHTTDSRGVMDITANLREMLASQAFRRSAFHPDVFPIGHQDAALLLVEAVGGDLETFKAAADEQFNGRSAWYDQGAPLPARLDQPFSACACTICAKQQHRRAAN